MDPNSSRCTACTAAEDELNWQGQKPGILLATLSVKFTS